MGGNSPVSDVMHPATDSHPAATGSTPQPRVSCIVVFLDGAAFIREAIDSVIVQTDGQWELLLVDDGSTDGSSDIARACAASRPGQVRYLEHPGHANRGECASRNLGIREAAGEYVVFLDADDVLARHAFEEATAILSSHADVALVYGRTERWYSWTGRPEDAGRDFISDPCVGVDAQYEPPTLLEVWLRNENAIPANCSTMFRRPVILKAGGFDETFGDAYEDLVLLSNVALTEAAFVAGSCWSRYRQHPKMSSVLREQAGQWHPTRPNPVRLRYLSWLERHLDATCAEQAGLRAELHRRLLPYRNPRLHRVRTSGGLARVRVTLALSGLGRRLRGLATGSLVARPNRIRSVNALGLGRTTLSWRSSNTENVEVHVGAPDGSLFSRSGPSGSATTDEWVADGTTFYLQDASVGRAAGASATLAVVRVRVFGSRPDSLAAATGQIPELERRVPPVGRVDFGDLARRTPISRDWGYDRGRPVSRYHIEQFLAEHARDIRGRVLEFGDDSYIRRFGGDAVEQRDVFNYKAGLPGTTFVGDLTDAPQLPSDAFHCIICTHTLHLIYDLGAAIRTLHRILKPGGVLLATVPGIGPTCGSWRESTYWKFTPLSAGRLFGDVFGSTNTEVCGHGNALTAVAFMHGLVTEDLTQADLDHREAGYEICLAIRAVKPVSQG